MGTAAPGCPAERAPLFVAEEKVLYCCCGCFGSTGGGLCRPPKEFIPVGFCPVELEFCCSGAATCNAGWAGVVINPPRSMVGS